MTELDRSVLCLDFDGVLCDSQYECLIVGYSVFYQRPIRLLDEVPAPVRDYFLNYRFLVAPADDYALIFQAFEAGMTPLTRERFEALAAQNPAARQQFGKAFFAYREQLRQNLQAWLDLHVLYQQAACVRDPAFPSFNIMTTKDQRSVELLAQSLGFFHKLERIYAKEVSVDKKTQFAAFFKDSRISAHDMDVIFVDDNIEHLRRLDGLGLHLYHASWGYCDPQEPSPYAQAKSLAFLEHSYETLKDLG